MKKNKLLLASIVSLLTISPVFLSNSQAHAAEVDNEPVSKVLMHTAVIYDKDGNNTGIKYKSSPYTEVVVDPSPVTINGGQYYKVSVQFYGKSHDNRYIKATNLDGVRRKVTHNTYIYSTSTKRTSYNGKWKLYKGATITTYGSSYKFKNGVRYFRVGEPGLKKQYIKSANLGSSIGASGQMKEEATVTVTDDSGEIYSNDGKFIKSVPKGTKFVVDRLEKTSFADIFTPYYANNGLYRIKGTNNWIVAVGVKADKKLPMHYAVKTPKKITTPTVEPASTEETIITVEDATNANIYDKQGNVVYKGLKKGNRIAVDRFQKTVPFANSLPSEWTNDGFYRVKGTDNWIVGALVKPDKQLPMR